MELRRYLPEPQNYVAISLNPKPFCLCLRIWASIFPTSEIPVGTIQSLRFKASGLGGRFKAFKKAGLRALGFRGLGFRV